jgi:hypothetical protein
LHRREQVDVRRERGEGENVDHFDLSSSSFISFLRSFCLRMLISGEGKAFGGSGVRWLSQLGLGQGVIWRCSAVDVSIRLEVPSEGMCWTLE